VSCYSDLLQQVVAVSGLVLQHCYPNTFQTHVHLSSALQCVAVSCCSELLQLVVAVSCCSEQLQ